MIAATSVPLRSSTRLSAVLLRWVLVILLGAMALVGAAMAASHVLPNEGQMAYISSQDGDYKIYLMDVGRTLSHKLSNRGVLNCCLSWSPDGKQIGFMIRLGLNNEIFLMDVATGKMRQMTRGSGGVQIGLVWSPDSQRFLVVSADGSYSGAYLLNVEDAQRQPFNENAAYGQSPHWSPDGRQIAFAMGTKGQLAAIAVGQGSSTDIYVADGDGNDAKMITQSDATNLMPAWSPDGEQIAFASVRGNDVQIYTTGRDGGAERQITQSAGEKWTPQWSPDGRQIAFLARREREVEIYTVDVTSGVEHQVTHNGVVWEWNVAWSPDGRYLKYEANPTGNFGVYVVNLADDHVRLLTPNLAYTSTQSNWRP